MTVIDELIDHYKNEGHVFRMTFTQAPPGLAPVVLARSLLEELAPSGQPAGAVLAYKPGKPIPDLTGREACYRGATEIIEARGRLIGDTRRSFERLARMIDAIGPDGGALSASRWLRDCDSKFVADHPAEIEIELTTVDPWQGGSILRPGSRDVPQYAQCTCPARLPLPQTGHDVAEGSSPKRHSSDSAMDLALRVTASGRAGNRAPTAGARLRPPDAPG